MPTSHPHASSQSVLAVSEQLLREGELDASWVDGILAAVTTETSLSKPGDTARWSAEEFRTYHFASMYLPLRYRAWQAFEGSRNPLTEHRLRLLVHGVDLGLWSAACRTVPPDEDGPEGRIVQLVLGPATPVAMPADERASWHEEYKSALANLVEARSASDDWPRWTAMALHFASFYLPIELPSAPETQSALAASLAASLRQHARPDAVRLISYWLTLAGEPRDESGLPSSAPQVHGALSIRMQTELALLGK